MDGWELIRALHLLGIAFFVGGQLMLVAVVAPALRDQDPLIMRRAAMRFGIGSAAALALIIGTGIALASQFDRWSDTALHVKLVLLAVVFALTAVHTRLPYARAVSGATLVLSLAIFWFGIDLAH